MARKGRFDRDPVGHASGLTGNLRFGAVLRFVEAQRGSFRWFPGTKQPVRNRPSVRHLAAHCVSDAPEMEFPLPVFVEDALIGGVPTLIAAHACEALTIEAAARRFFR